MVLSFEPVAPEMGQKCSNLGRFVPTSTEVGTAASPATARVVPTLPTFPTIFKHQRARARTPAPTHITMNIMSDRLEQLEQAHEISALECSNLAEGRHKTPEVGTDHVNAESEPLAWAKTSRYSQRADTGHRVSAAKSLDTWIYSAWAPDVAPDVKYYEWPRAEFGGREHYPRGVAVPQRCAWLGDYATPEDAREACQAHAHVMRLARAVLARDGAETTP